MVEKARLAVQVTLPARQLRDLSQRAATLGIGLETLDGGAGLRLRVELPSGETGPSCLTDSTVRQTRRVDGPAVIGTNVLL